MQKSDFIYSALKDSINKDSYNWVISLKKDSLQGYFSEMAEFVKKEKLSKNQSPVIVDDELINDFYQFIKEITK